MDGPSKQTPCGSPEPAEPCNAGSERDLLLEIRRRQLAQDDRLTRIEWCLGLLRERKEIERLQGIERAEQVRAAARGVRRVAKALGGKSAARTKHPGR